MNLISNYFNESNITYEICAFTHCDSNWHEDNIISRRNCFYYIIEGEGEIIINDISFHPVAGDLFFIPFGAKVSYRPISTNYYKKYWCHFQATYHSCNLFDIIDIPYVTHIGKNEMIENDFKMLIDYNDNSIFSCLMNNSYMIKLLSDCLKIIGTEHIRFNTSIPIDKIIMLNDYIYSNISSVITLEQLADLVHFHPNYFIRFFQKYFGTSPIKYVSKIRIERAKELLTTTSLSIEEIAISLGYSNAFHFSSRFKSDWGYAPSIYRQL